MKKVNILFLAIFFFLSFPYQKMLGQKLETPLESNQYTSLTTNDEIRVYLQEAERISDLIHIEEVGESVQGKPIYLVKISRTEVADSEKVKVLIFAQQHGNEPSGKEGVLLLIQQIAEGKHHELFRTVNLYLMPQVNPDGGDAFQRRNANDIDLNRDHLLLRAPESQVVQQVFRKYKPEISIDLHEYYPHGKYWKKFGYRKNFDIQLGGLTNSNIREDIYKTFKAEVFPYVKSEVENSGYSFFEYTLGDLPDGERLRHSTVDVNDGRQSIGITNTLSFIIEGMRGKEMTDSIKRRTESQYVTMLALLKYAAHNAGKIKTMVHGARNELMEGITADSIAIRLDHFPGDDPLHYPLYDYKTGKDSVFVVEKYYSLVKPTLNVAKPKGYLIPKNDDQLVEWLKRSGFSYTGRFNSDDATVYKYAIGKIETTEDEGIENKFVEVIKTPFPGEVNAQDYYFVPVDQIFMFKIVTALEPQSMYGLVYYPEFEYLLDNDYFPVLRVE